MVFALQFIACASTPVTDPVAQSENPLGIAPLIAEAERAMQRGDLDAAVSAYREALDQTPWNKRVARALAGAHASRALRLREQRSLPGAERELRAARLLQPDDVDLGRSLAVVLLERAALEHDADRAGAMRAEALELAPDLRPGDRNLQAALERRLDLAFELLERGQLEAGIARLSQLRAEHPERDDVLRLLAQAHVRHGNALFSQRNFGGAAAAFERAVIAYQPLGLCEQGGCQRAEVELAHHNRIVALLEAASTREARAALAQANTLGLVFPELRDALPAVDFD